jgi:hypothetical protein
LIERLALGAVQCALLTAQLLPPAASAQERLVSITLDSRKVYIGTVAAAPNLETHDVFLALTPIFSGYRDKDTLDLVLTVPYLDVYQRENLDPEDFTITIPIQHVRIASFFDHTVYKSFQVAMAESPEFLSDEPDMGDEEDEGNEPRFD